MHCCRLTVPQRLENIKKIDLKGLVGPEQGPMHGNDLHIRNQRKKLSRIGNIRLHHEYWGSTDINQRGENLFEYILPTDLDIMNSGNTPTFVTSARSEVLDITMANTYGDRFISEWRVDDERRVPV